ncbi:MAG TPA: hypothetical protein VFG10_11440 [Saprospiraceae bacterium]|nr:hypothetical protein [Saprospiraceae bacterium]
MKITHSVHRFIVIVYIILANLIVANAQNDIREGAIILPGGEVKKGWIDFKDGKKNYQFCKFKADPHSEFITYLPADLEGYEYEGDAKYVSRWIGEDSSKHQSFLEVLLEGHYTLLKTFEYYFIESGTDVFEQITFDPVIITINNLEIKKPSPKNLNVIRYLIKDCKELNSEIDGVKLYDKGLVHLIRDMNTCMGFESSEMKSDKPWASFALKAMAGITFSIFDVQDTDYGDAAVGLPYSKSNTATFGIGFEFSSPRNIESLLFEGDVFFTQSRYSSTSFEDKLNDEYNYVNFTFTELKIPAGLTFKLKSRGLIPYVKVGGSVNLNLSSEDEWIRQIVMGDVILTEIGDAMETQNFHLGIWGGIGVSKTFLARHEVFLEFKVEKTHGISNIRFVNPPYFSNFTYFTLLAGIKL